MVEGYVVICFSLMVEGYVLMFKPYSRRLCSDCFSLMEEGYVVIVLALWKKVM